jgi:hypothetical protein
LILVYQESGKTKEKSLRFRIKAPRHVFLAGRVGSQFLAERVWDYIQLFMQEGREALPDFEETVEPFRLEHVRQIPQVWGFHAFMRSMLGFPVLLWPVTIPLYFFVVLPIWISAWPAELLFMLLDRLLPYRKWPRELVRACDGIWDGTKDYGVTGTGGGGKVSAAAALRARRQWAQRACY